MNVDSLLSLLLLIVVLYIAFRVGAIILKVLLGLLAIGLFIWFIANMLGIVI